MVSVPETGPLMVICCAKSGSAVRALMVPVIPVAFIICGAPAVAVASALADVSAALQEPGPESAVLLTTKVVALAVIIKKENKKVRETWMNLVKFFSNLWCINFIRVKSVK